MPQTETAGIQTSGVHLDTKIIQECQQFLFLPSKPSMRVTAPPQTKLARTFIGGPEQRVTYSTEMQLDQLGLGTCHPSPFPANPGQGKKIAPIKKETNTKTRPISKVSLIGQLKQKPEALRAKGVLLLSVISLAVQTALAFRATLAAPSSTSPAHPEDSVEGEFAKFRSHGGLGQLGHCILRIFYPVAGLESRSKTTESVAVPRGTLNEAGQANRH